MVNYWVSFGECYTPLNEVACRIFLKTTRTTYFHQVGSSKILNTFGFADPQSPKQDYLDIREGIGDLAPDRVITGITAYRWDITANGGAGAYVSTSLGADLSFFNGKD